VRRRVSKKLLDFTGTKISDVKAINPLFSTCKVRVLYTGKNRNMSIISRDAVEKALPSIIGVPIVGEFSMEAKDFKGHGGAIDLDSYDFIHTTKPYGFVPQDATFSWEEVKQRDGSIREYLTVDGCYLWTGRYPEAFSIVEQGKGQSMEIEVNDGEWNDAEEAYDIKQFTFSALCILGDDVEPAFEDANITASFSLDSDVFKMEYAKMMQDVKSTLLNKEKEVNDEMLKQLLAKYSTTMEVLTAKGLNFSEISEDELEAKIAEALEVEVIVEDDQAEQAEQEAEGQEEGEASQEESQESDENAEGEASADVDQEEGEEDAEQAEDNADESGADAQEDDAVEGEENEAEQVDVEALNARIAQLETELATAVEERDSLREFKLEIEKADHEAKASKLFSDFQLTEEDVKDLDVHQFSIEQIEEKCYAILGRKLATKKNFSLKSKDNGGIRLPLGNEDSQEQKPTSPYGDLFEKYNK
jgi:hypothetical protein